MTDDQKQDESLETDDRFVSGPWVGFFLQPRLTSCRFKMELVLTFRNGKFSGEGQDAISKFVIRGQYDIESGEVTLHKRYLSMHDVHYRGFAEGKGIWGVWTLRRNKETGGFHIWPKSMGDLTDNQQGETKELPVELPVLVGVEAVESEKVLVRVTE